jgi:hypothetical protein
MSTLPPSNEIGYNNVLLQPNIFNFKKKSGTSEVFDILTTLPPQIPNQPSRHSKSIKKESAPALNSLIISNYIFLKFISYYFSSHPKILQTSDAEINAKNLRIIALLQKHRNKNLHEYSHQFYNASSHQNLWLKSLDNLLFPIVIACKK